MDLTDNYKSYQNTYGIWKVEHWNDDVSQVKKVEYYQGRFENVLSLWSQEAAPWISISLLKVQTV